MRLSRRELRDLHVALARRGIHDAFRARRPRTAARRPRTAARRPRIAARLPRIAARLPRTGPTVLPGPEMLVGTTVLPGSAPQLTWNGFP